MKWNELARKYLWWRGFVLCAALVTAGQAVAAETGKDWETQPYFIIDNKVDFGTYNGFRRYHSACHVCHGPDALGSSYAPGLVEPMKTLEYGKFLEIVAMGRTTDRGGTKFVMPSFGNNPNVTENLDDIYSYLKARADGVLGRGRPSRLPKGTKRP